MKRLIALSAITILAGCANLNPMVAAYETKVAKDIEGANDNAIRAIQAAICATPYGAIIRNTEFIPVAKAACIPAGAQSSPSSLLDNIPVK